MSEKKNQNSKWARLRRSIICRLKEELEFIDVKIMSYVLVVVLMVSVTAATVAWFLNGSPANILGMNLTTGSTQDIEVSLNRDEWENVLEAYDDTEGDHGIVTEAEITISMPAFENIYDKEGTLINEADAGIMAPGTYGEFTFYVKSVNEYYDKCQINISKVLEAVTDDQTLMSEVNELLKGHILCFAKVDESYFYVSEDKPLEISFTFTDGACEPQEVCVYWVWPYEYQDLAASVMKIGEIEVGSESAPVNLFALPVVADMPTTLSVTSGNYANTGYELACNQVFEWERYGETISKFADADDKTKEEMLCDWYDYADTLVGTCVENVVFHVGIKGVVSDE